MTNDKKLMLLAGVLALGMLAGCSSASAASAASGMAGSMPAASEVEEVSSEVRAPISSLRTSRAWTPRSAR